MIKKEIILNGDTLTIKNVKVFFGKIYRIFFKIGFLGPIVLNDSEETGFGTVNLLKEGQIIINGKANKKSGFNKVSENKNIFMTESVDTL